MKTDYIKIFTGNAIETQRIVTTLEAVGINAVVKNEVDSARMAGFATPNEDIVEVYVHKDELIKAEAALQ